MVKQQIIIEKKMLGIANILPSLILSSMAHCFDDEDTSLRS